MGAWIGARSRMSRTRSDNAGPSAALVSTASSLRADSTCPVAGPAALPPHAATTKTRPKETCSLMLDSRKLEGAESDTRRSGRQRLRWINVVPATLLTRLPGTLAQPADVGLAHGG